MLLVQQTKEVVWVANGSETVREAHDGRPEESRDGTTGASSTSKDAQRRKD